MSAPNEPQKKPRTLDKMIRQAKARSKRPMIRVCLRCNGEFVSLSAGYRICNDCKRAERNMRNPWSALATRTTTADPEQD